jgi:3-oxoacyl-[acyl-carrier-protein] synthase II
VAECFGWQGQRTSIATACSSSGASLGLAAEAIRRGRITAALVVGSEALSRLTYGGFHSLRALAPDTCRPFDLNRRGLVLGEGAGAIVLEDMEAAAARGAPNYGEILGWGWTADGHHMTAPHPEGLGAQQAMQAALKRSGLLPDQIEYINAHGTGTRQNDAAETKAVKSLFGGHSERLKLSSTKSMTGHCLGAAGIIESVSTLLAIGNKTVPPTANLEQADPVCDLDYVPVEAQTMPELKRAMNNVMAFGGNNVALVFQSPS